MKRIYLSLILIIILVIPAMAGCEFLPPLPGMTQTTPPVTTQVPPDLTTAANRIIPSTVIVDTPFATGTGWILDSSGIIATNYHVIEGARIIVVTLHDGQRLNVRSIAADPVSDLAILRVNGTSLPAAAIGSSAALRAGDPVVAVGNSNGEGISVKTGVVTRLNVTVGIENEQYYGLIEDNAPIQEGDSGGPLVNQNGEVVGISNAKVIGLEEIAYAISIDSAMPILEQLVTTGSVTRAYLGISGLDNPGGSGVLLEEITAGGPAEGAGLLPGDVILAIDGATMRDMDELRQTIRSKDVGQRIVVTYRRGGTQAEAFATLIQYPAL